MLPIAPPLVGWFQLNRRSLPFREDPTPYHVWVSEIMLQQTRMNAVLPYYERFMAALPDIPALAAVPIDELRRIWQGLGYYSRAINLQKAAQIVCRDYGGELPADYDLLRTLPGIGPYTAGAIASISFGIPVPAVDGNVLRVFARLYDDNGDISEPDTKARFTARVTETLPPSDAGNFNQALMELGALVCTPKSPDCSHCPLADLCLGHAAGHAAVLPCKAPKKARSIQCVTVALVRSARGYLLEKRSESGLLAGLWQPFAVCADRHLSPEEIAARLAAIGIEATYTVPLPDARHLFTHVEWHLRGYAFDANDVKPLSENLVWASDCTPFAIPSAYRVYREYLYGKASL